jgi:hypothetical protein
MLRLERDFVSKVKVMKRQTSKRNRINHRKSPKDDREPRLTCAGLLAKTLWILQHVAKTKHFGNGYEYRYITDDSFELVRIRATKL